MRLGYATAAGLVFTRTISALLATVAVGAVVLGGAPAAAQQGGNAVNGRMLAERLCSSCHAIDPVPSSVPRADIPTFAAIAALPQTTPERLAGAIILPHPEMPDVALTRNELRAVIAYIMTLRPVK